MAGRIPLIENIIELSLSVLDRYLSHTHGLQDVQMGLEDCLAHVFYGIAEIIDVQYFWKF